MNFQLWSNPAVVRTAKLQPTGLRAAATIKRRTSRIAFALGSLLFLSGTSLVAQTAVQVGIPQGAHPQPAMPTAPKGFDTRDPRVRRALMGLGGEMFGIFAGGFFGVALAERCNKAYSCGLGYLMIGSFVGQIVGTAAFAAAAPSYSACSDKHRFLRALAGASVGAVAGVASLAVAGGAGIPVVLLAPPGMAAHALKKC
ncbi:MAG: hypothetical protein WKF55_15885 [Gemmatimonadaceae bacterium]